MSAQPELAAPPAQSSIPRKTFNLVTTLLLATSAALAQTQPASTPAAMEHRFAESRRNPLELYAFLYHMPKGGDLHNHLSGAIYAETFLKAAAGKSLCIDTSALAIVAPPCTGGNVDASKAQSDNDLRNAMIDSLSMRNFVAGRESAHDHFFATFGKFGQLSSYDFVAEIAQRAGDQNESYLELMALSGGGGINALGLATGLDDDFDVTRRKLEQNPGYPGLLKALRTRVDEMEQTRRTVLHCDAQPDSAACRVQVHYVYQVLRESPKAGVFAQVIAGFAAAAADPRVVAVNFVQPEDGVTSMGDYHLQMRMVEYAKRIYPNVHITLHAGELAPGLVPPDGLLFHIREAVELGHAERIGHGVDVMYERDPAALLKEMHDKRIAVEINLTSNDVILGISGDQHPFTAYRKAGVPLVLSTDDEGVSRSLLTHEFERAVLTYHLSYADLKELVRNSLEYSFAPGASYWEKNGYTRPVAACAAGKQSPACKDFLNKNEKARLEADLEERFADFEKVP
jgi:adenosine deaminase